MVLFALVLLLGRTLWSLAVNTWTIEGWEIERHHTLLRRAKVLGGYLEGPDGTKVRIDHQEFPWDVGIWSNICQGMGSRNPLSWFWPFSRSPSVESGLSFEHNEIDGEYVTFFAASQLITPDQIQASLGRHQIQTGCSGQRGSH